MFLKVSVVSIICAIQIQANWSLEVLRRAPDKGNQVRQDPWVGPSGESAITKFQMQSSAQHSSPTRERKRAFGGSSAILGPTGARQQLLHKVQNLQSHKDNLRGQDATRGMRSFGEEIVMRE